MIKVRIAADFSRYPAGRFNTDGPFSGEDFREKFLLPHLKNKTQLSIELDGTRGYGSSFLEEAFGGLVRAGIDKNWLLEGGLQFVTDKPSLKEEVLDYIREAKRQ